MMRDPTLDEMWEFLTLDGNSDEFETEAAIYWFAADNHGGQGSNLYSALSLSRYSPGMTERRPRGEARIMYDALTEEFSK